MPGAGCGVCEACGVWHGAWGVGRGAWGVSREAATPVHLECERAAVIEGLGVVWRELYGLTVGLHRLAVQRLLAQAVAAVGVRLAVGLVELQRLVDVDQRLQG